MEKYVLMFFFLHFCLGEQENILDQVNPLKPQLVDTAMADRKKVMKGHLLSYMYKHTRAPNSVDYNGRYMSQSTWPWAQ